MFVVLQNQESLTEEMLKLLSRYINIFINESPAILFGICAQSPPFPQKYFSLLLGQKLTIMKDIPFTHLIIYRF